MYREYIPSTELQPYIKCYWTFTSQASVTKIIPPQRILPDPCVELFFHFRDLFRRYNYASELTHQNYTSGIMGPHRQNIYLEPQGNVSMAGIRFREGYAGMFLKLPTVELSGMLIDVQALFGTEYNHLQQSMHALFDHGDCRAVNRFFESRIGWNYAPPLYILELIKRGKAAIAVDMRLFARQCGISQRHLERQFKAFTGLSFTHFCRIVRMNITARLLTMNSTNMTDLAYQLGFYDQAHFIHDFRNLTGTSPLLYKKEQHDMKAFGTREY